MSLGNCQGHFEDVISEFREKNPESIAKTNPILISDETSVEILDTLLRGCVKNFLTTEEALEVFLMNF